MQKLTILDGDCAIAKGGNEMLCSPRLGNSVLVAAHDPLNHITGMVRFAFPRAELSPAGRRNPCLFGDTAVEYLLHSMAMAGSTLAGLRTFVFGRTPEAAPSAQVGEWNLLSALAALWNHRLLARQEVGDISFVTMTGHSAQFWIRYTHERPCSAEAVIGAPHNPSCRRRTYLS
ncbi:MAG: hypothetical protein HY820_29370 [Acidobacteria bacterium]|nr:hypothetical protein [Acidobacteriota bacterium]